MNDHPLIFESGILTCFENLFWGLAHIVSFPIREVTFQRLSEGVKTKALLLGFSPPIHLPSRMSVEDNSYISDWWILTGELIYPIIRIRSDNGRDFFEISSDEPMDDARVIESITKVLKEDSLYSDTPEAKLFQVWQEKDGTFNATIQVDTETIHLYELINEVKLIWLLIGEDRKFLVSSKEVKTIYQAPQTYPSYCKSCGTPINLVKTKAGKFMPLELTGVPHWANCPDAKKFKK